MNILLLTVDDMNYNSIGAFGCPVEGTTPRIDALAKEGMRFANAHVPIAVCQPSRSSLMTGRYPHRNGARGFERIEEDVPTLTECLNEHGFYNGIIGKENHLAPKEKFCWDEYIQTENEANDFGRNPEKYYEFTKQFISHAKQKNAPFFLMANCHDPHRPFAGSDDEILFFGRHIAAEKTCLPEEIEVPGFLPDIPEVRKEMAQYYTSVRRADASVGRILDALKEAELEEDTLVWFLSDNGMALPFAKTNCYLNSTKSPWILRWPRVIAADSTNEALVSGIDFMATILDWLGLPLPEGMDGVSIRDVIEQQRPEHYETIYTQFFKTAKNQITQKERHYPMRCVQNKRYAYLYNAWSDQEPFMNESMAGLTFQAMKEAAKTDSEIAARVEFYQYRIREELYDFIEDPDALCNLAGTVEYGTVQDQLRKEMERYIVETGDEIADFFYEDFKKDEKKEKL